MRYQQCYHHRSECYSLLFDDHPADASSRTSDSLLVDAELDSAYAALAFWLIRFHQHRQLQVPILGTYAFLPLSVTSVHCPSIMTGVSLELFRISVRKTILFFGTHFLGPLLLVFFLEVLGTLGT